MRLFKILELKAYDIKHVFINMWSYLQNVEVTITPSTNKVFKIESMFSKLVIIYLIVLFTPLWLLAHLFKKIIFHKDFIKFTKSKSEEATKDVR